MHRVDVIKTDCQFCTHASRECPLLVKYHLVAIKAHLNDAEEEVTCQGYSPRWYKGIEGVLDYPRPIDGRRLAGQGVGSPAGSFSFSPRPSHRVVKATQSSLFDGWRRVDG